MNKYDIKFVKCIYTSVRMKEEGIKNRGIE